MANDGEAGEGDNVLGVERLSARADVVTLTGDDGPNDFLVEAGSSTVRGLGGDDRLVTYDGNDTIEGGDGNDFIEAGFGNDILDGGAGVDQFSGDRTESTCSPSATTRSARATATRSRSAAASAAATGRSWTPTTWSPATARPSSGPPSRRDPAGPDPAPDAGPHAGQAEAAREAMVKTIASKGLAIEVSCPAACAVTGQLRVNKVTARKLRLGKSRRAGARARRRCGRPGPRR